MDAPELVDEPLSCPRCGSQGVVRAGLCRSCGALVDDFAMDEAMLRRGELFSEKYRVCALLGTGTFGEVYRVEHLLLRREMALKVLRPELGTDRDIAERFLREIHIAMDFVHQGAVAIREAGKADGLLYYTMDLCRGATLERLVREEGPLDVGRLVHLADPFLGCLAEAHLQGILHRDLKPANLMVERDSGTERIHVIDFGVARIFQDVESHRTTGGAMGSPAYLAPEVIRGATHGVAADQYAAACVLYFAATGEPPFQGQSSRDVIMAHLEQEPRPPSEKRADLPAQLDSVLLHALAKDPAERYESVTEMRRALRAILRDSPTVRLTGRLEDLPRIPARVASGLPPRERSLQPAEWAVLPPVRVRALPPRRGGSAWALLIALVFVCGAIFGAAWFARLEKMKNEARALEPLSDRAGVLDPSGKLAADRGPIDASEAEGGTLLPSGPNATPDVELDPAASGSEEAEGVAAVFPADLLIELDPRSAVPVREARIHLEGRVPGVDEARLLVDGAEGRVLGGTFKHPIELPGEGRHSVVLEVLTEDGRRGSLETTLIVDRTPPVLTLETPVASGQRTTESELEVRGRALDPHLRVVRVAEREVSVDPSGRFAERVPLQFGENVVHVLALDQAGNASETLVRVHRESSLALIESVEPGEGSISRTSRIQVILRTHSDLSEAWIDGTEAFVQASGREAQGHAVLEELGENAIEIVAKDRRGGRQRILLHVRYWPFPEWMSIDDLEDLRIDEETGLPWRVRRRSDDAEMVLVKAREFLLGNGNRLARAPREKPARRVILTENYYIDRLELSNRQYKRFVSDARHAPPQWWKDGLPPEGKEDLPVVGISWDDAMAYARWASVELPTEAQWEFAAKGETNWRYPWGDDLHQQRASFDGAGSYGEHRVAGQFLTYLLPVDSCPQGASPFGAVQMSGNAWEWCRDGFVEDAYSRLVDFARDPFLPPEGTDRRSARGGCWYSLGNYVTTTYRMGFPRTHVDPTRDSVGARFVRVLTPEDYPPR